MKPSVNILISGGGTGGHIFPAIAIANELKRRNGAANFLFVGAKNRMEMEKVPQAGYPIEGLWISGIQRKISLQNLVFPLKLISSLWKAKRIIKKFKPQVVVGTGGFASGPTLEMAHRRGIPTLVQEQNSYPGITNKMLAKKTQRICVAYDGLERFFPKEKIIKTGNPVRQDLIKITEKRQDALDFYSLKPNIMTVLVLGGSLGAKAINELVASRLNYFRDKKVQLIWQTGKLYYEQYQGLDLPLEVKLLKFIDRMDLAYAAADIIISRAGAGSISELCIVGKPVIFIPSPNVSEDHQTKNAQAIVQKKAAILIKESELDMFNQKMDSLLEDKELQQLLALNIKALAMPMATSAIADEVEKLIENK